MDENIIIEKIRAGDSAAYRYLVERYQTGLIIHCEQLVHDRQEAEDIAQDTFIKAYERIRTFDKEKGRFSTWLYRIAGNKAIDYLRRNKRKVDVEHIEELADIATEPQLLEDEAMHIRSLVDSLEPPIYSQIIKAYYWQGKNYKKIAEEYGLSINTVGTWLKRAKSQLKEQLS